MQCCVQVGIDLLSSWSSSSTGLQSSAAASVSTSDRRWTARARLGADRIGGQGKILSDSLCKQRMKPLALAPSLSVQVQRGLCLAG